MRFLLLSLVILLPTYAFSHGDSHDKPPEEKPITNNAVDSHTDGQHGSVIPKPHTDKKKSIITQITLKDFSFSEFKTLHPMIVHIPVTLIPIAFLIFLIGLFSRKKEYTIIGTGLIIIGAIGAYLAAYPTHPHTANLPAEALITLKKHDLFAYTTLTLSIISAVLALICVFLKQRLRILQWLTALVLLASTITVAITGHYGGTLSLIHGIGAQGKYLK